VFSIDIFVETRLLAKLSAGLQEMSQRSHSMGTDRLNRRTRLLRAIEVLAILAALVTTFAVGVWLGPMLEIRSFLAQPPSPIVQSSARSSEDSSSGFPSLESSQPEDPRRPEAHAVEARKQIIARDANAILAECQRAAGGDWDKWQRESASYRTALLAKIEALKERPPADEDGPAVRNEPLEGQNGFPLFELGSRFYLDYLYDPAILDRFRRERQVVAARNWLHERGIDLIFVPIPKMTEIYIDKFLDPCPSDGIIAPHVRHTLLELLQEDVEVVDAFTVFRARRDADVEYLYNTADGHWAPRGMRIMAKEIADRIERYNFGKRARYGLPLVRGAPGRYEFRDVFGSYKNYGREVLSPEQAKRAAAVQTTTQVEVRMQDGKRPPPDPASPVVVIGHSFAWNFREQLIKELNLLIETRVAPDQTTESFADFLRQPELLAHCRVLVWITTEQHLSRSKPLPGPVAECLKSAGDLLP
jgi:hypothetical protein